MSDKEYWKRFKEYHDRSCEEMESQPNSDEYWKQLEKKNEVDNKTY